MRPPHVRLLDGKWRRERDSNPRAVRPLVFKTSAIDHSAISPGGVHAWSVWQPTTRVGRRDRNRTCNLRIWRPLLCLIELPAFTPRCSIQEKMGYCKSVRLLCGACNPLQCKHVACTTHTTQMMHSGNTVVRMLTLRHIHPQCGLATRQKQVYRLYSVYPFSSNFLNISRTCAV